MFCLILRVVAKGRSLVKITRECAKIEGYVQFVELEILIVGLLAQMPRNFARAFKTHVVHAMSHSEYVDAIDRSCHVIASRLRARPSIMFLITAIWNI